MVSVTLVGERIAKIKNEFVYLGPTIACRECKVKGVCLNLDPGHRYRIDKVRDVKHECLINGDGVRVVEVNNASFTAAISQKYAVKGMSMVHEMVKCSMLSCKDRKYCFSPGLVSGGKYRVVDVLNILNCAKKEQIVNVVLEKE